VSARRAGARTTAGRPSAGSPRAAAPRAFASLAAVERAVIACERCPRLRRYCEGIAREKKRAFAGQTYWGRPVPGFGDPRARVLVVGLAPAAHGGNRTGRIFTGDSSGSWLYEALHRFRFANQPDSSGRGDGLVLSDCYVTAAGRCAPPANRPTPRELASCRPYLEAEIRLLRGVRVTVTLGHIAHRAWLGASGWWERLPAAERPRFAHGAEHALPDGSTLLCSYHPSRQNTNTKRLTRAMWHEIFRRVRARVDEAGR
jgi:uracil-DNA glycosylase family 4